MLITCIGGVKGGVRGRGSAIDERSSDARGGGVVRARSDRDRTGGVSGSERARAVVL